MIKFFRKIRQKLLMENKTSKYFKYAIGEIILVVIGILIALQINNWNENRKSIKLGQSLLKELIGEFQLHIQAFDYGLEQQIESFEKQQKIVKIKDLESISRDSLFGIFGFANIDINISSHTYEKIKNLGIDKLSENDSLNKAINYHLMETIVLYNYRINYNLKRSKRRADYIYQSNIQIKNDLIEGLPVISEKVIKESSLNFVKTTRAKRIIIESYQDKITAIEYLIRKKKRWIELINAIYNELLLTETDLAPLPSFDKYLDYTITK